jgi:hypothetical protein
MEYAFAPGKSPVDVQRDNRNMVEPLTAHCTEEYQIAGLEIITVTVRAIIIVVVVVDDDDDDDDDDDVMTLGMDTAEYSSYSILHIFQYIIK